MFTFVITMRAVGVLIILFLLFLNLFGFYIAFSFRQNCIHKQMSQVRRVEKEKTHSLYVVSRSDYNKIVWLRKGREFRLGEKLYDVEFCSFEGDKLVMYIEEDSKETKLVDDYILSVKKDKRDTNSPLENLYKAISKDFLIPTAELKFPVPFDSFRFIPTQLNLTGIVLNLQSPPPDFS